MGVVGIKIFLRLPHGLRQVGYLVLPFVLPKVLPLVIPHGLQIVMLDAQKK